MHDHLFMQDRRQQNSDRRNIPRFTEGELHTLMAIEIRWLKATAIVVGLLSTVHIFTALKSGVENISKGFFILFISGFLIYFFVRRIRMVSFYLENHSIANLIRSQEVINQQCVFYLIMFSLILLTSFFDLI